MADEPRWVNKDQIRITREELTDFRDRTEDEALRDRVDYILDHGRYDVLWVPVGVHPWLTEEQAKTLLGVVDPEAWALRPTTTTED